jgi:hypothetical protein
MRAVLSHEQMRLWRAAHIPRSKVKLEMTGRIKLKILAVAISVFPTAITGTALAQGQARGSPTPASQTSAKTENVLRSLPTHVPELALADVRTHRNTAQAFYIPANEPNDDRTPNLMLISISSYDSEEEAQRGLEKGLFTTSVVPSQKETIKSVTVYKWNEYGSHRIFFQIGRSVIDISALRPPAEPMIMRVFDSLVQELGTN